MWKLGLDWSQGAFWQSADTIGLHWVGVNLLLTPDREPFQNSPYAPFLQFQLGSSYTTINMETMHRSYRVIKKVKADHLGISGTSGKSGKSGTDEGKEFSDWSLLPDKVFVRIMKHLLTGQWPAAIHHLMSTRVYQTASFSSFGMFVTTI